MANPESLKSKSTTKKSAGLIAVSMLFAAINPASVLAQEKINEQLDARGLLRPLEKVEFSSNLRAKALKTPFREGDSFKKDEVLIAFDCQRYEAELKAAKAGADAAWTEYKSKKRLLAYQAIGKDEVRLAAAQAGKASAEVDVHQVVNQECEIRAPFDGRVVSRSINENEYPSNDQPLMVVLNDAVLEIEMVVPSHWLTWLQLKQPLVILVDETRERVPAVLDRIGAEVDPVSQTIKVFARMNADGFSILAGMSGTVTFKGGS
ncbi:MAG: efflux RND transporter periplasmic adaptor subunit [Salaquimonas sp.]